MSAFWKNSWEIIKILALAFIIVMPIRLFLVQPFYVKGTSMDPNFKDGEYLIIDEISYRFHAPQRGDIVVFRYPADPQEHFIKRVIGLPGEKVEIKDNQVYINDKPLNESAYLDPSVITQTTKEGAITVGPDEYYVMGDNRPASKDSRFFGPVKKSFFTGRVELRGLPFNRVGVFHTPVYNYN
jgi:signal peptidase I